MDSGVLRRRSRGTENCPTHLWEPQTRAATTATSGTASRRRASKSESRSGPVSDRCDPGPMEGDRRSGSTAWLHRMRLRLDAPSGDDGLVGVLAGFTASEEVADQARGNLVSRREAPHEVRSQRATHLAATQLIAAVADGAFPDLLGDFVAGLGVANATGAWIRQCVERAAHQGATSGSCFLLGFTAAQQASRGMRSGSHSPV